MCMRKQGEILKKYPDPLVIGMSAFDTEYKRISDEESKDFGQLL